MLSTICMLFGILFLTQCVVTDCVESWASVDLVVDSNLEATAIVTSRLSQPFEGSGLRVIYLAERVCCRLAGKDVP